MNYQNENPAQEPSKSSPEPLSIRDQWNEISPLLPDVFACLKRESQLATDTLKLKLDRLGTFLQDQPDCEDALENHDAMMMLLPLMRTHDAEQAVRTGVAAIARGNVYRRNWIQLFWYPVLVVLAALILGIFLSITVEPEIRMTIDQLRGFGFSGREPPVIQRSLLGEASVAIAALLRQTWPLILIALIVGTIGGVIYNRSGRRSNRSGLGWWDDWNISVRGALAIWASHVSTLLKVGIEQTEAFTIVSKEAPKSSLRKLSNALANRDAVIARHKSTATDTTDPKNLPRYFPLKKYTLLDEALRLKSTSLKTAALDEVAFYYRTRDRIVSTWWLSWVSVGMLWGTGLVVLVFVLPLFYSIGEIIKMISGITN